MAYHISDKEAFELLYKLIAKTEGLFLGTSCGVIGCWAMQMAKEMGLVKILSQFCVMMLISILVRCLIKIF